MEQFDDLKSVYLGGTTLAKIIPRGGFFGPQTDFGRYNNLRIGQNSEFAVLTLGIGILQRLIEFV